MNFVRKIPSKLNLRRGVTKYILKKSISKRLPSKIINRKKKGFGVPVGQWFRNGSLEFHPHFEITSKLLEEHKSNKRDHRLALFADYMLNEKLIPQSK